MLVEERRTAPGDIARLLQDLRAIGSEIRRIVGASRTLSAVSRATA